MACANGKQILNYHEREKLAHCCLLLLVPNSSAACMPEVGLGWKKLYFVHDIEACQP